MRITLFVLAIAFAGCNKSETPASAEKPAAKPSASEAQAPPREAKPAEPAVPKKTEKPAAGSITVGGLTFVPDAGWVRETPKSGMRLAQFKLPRVDGDPRDGEMTVITAGGTVQANIDRWKGQFEGEPTLTRDSIDSKLGDVAWVRLDGTYLFKARPMAPGPGTPQPDTAVLGGIVKTPNGRTFFKAWGPKKTMDKWEASLKTTLASLDGAK